MTREAALRTWFALLPGHEATIAWGVGWGIFAKARNRTLRSCVGLCMAPDHVKDSFYWRAMRTGIGVALREQYAANEPLTERLAKLLKELDKAETKARPK